jgi:spore maturation protein CgeB
MKRWQSLRVGAVQRDLILVGPLGNTHVCGSLARAASDLGVSYSAMNTLPAYDGPAIVRKLLWHFGGRRPPRLRAFSADLLRAATVARPCAVITLGQVPVSGRVISRLRQGGIACCNFSTDDPFNPAVKAPWHLRDLRAYDLVFSPRRANIEELRRLGCADVRFLPFGYDDHLFSAPANPFASERAPADVLFVGGADGDRAGFFAGFVKSGVPVALIGGRWERYPISGAHTLGLRSADCIRDMTACVPVNICLVRRANRDDHVMRSFEIPAVGGFMVAEDTSDHRDIFGDEGECVLYFKTPEEAARKCAWAIAHEDDRRRMAAAAIARLSGGGHTYRDRLRTMLGELNP